MTWWEFNVFALRYLDDKAKEKGLEDANWARWRSSMCLLANIYRDKKTKPTPYSPTDFVRLSFDDDMERDAHKYSPPTPELIEHLKKRFGSTIKKKDGK